MKTPKESAPQKTREKLWHETVIGYAVSAGGVGLIWAMLNAPDHPHGGKLIWVGVGLLAYGLFSVNKKLSREYLDELRKSIPFLKGGE